MIVLFEFSKSLLIFFFFRGIDQELGIYRVRRSTAVPRGAMAHPPLEREDVWEVYKEKAHADAEQIQATVWEECDGARLCMMCSHFLPGDWHSIFGCSRSSRGLVQAWKMEKQDRSQGCSCPCFMD